MQKKSNYGFYGRLKNDFPSQINVDLTEVCNLACIHCPHPTFKQSEHYNARYLPVELNQKMVDEVKKESNGSMQYIRYSGEGEPLIHPKGYDIIEYAVKNSGVYVTLTTNGTIMNEKRTLRLLEAGVHMIDISIDAFKNDTYSRIRVNGDLEVTRNNVLLLLRMVRESKSNTKVVVSFVEQEGNKGEADDFKRFWEEHGANYVIIRRLHSAAGALETISEAMKSNSKEIPRRPCVYPWERIVLNPRGFLAFCPTDWTNTSGMNDFRKTTIKETWQSEFYSKLRNAHIKNDFSCHKFCGQCPDWQQTRWPDEGRGYADLVEEFKLRQ